MPTAATQKSDSTKRAVESLRSLVRLLARRAAQEALDAASNPGVLSQAGQFKEDKTDG